MNMMLWKLSHQSRQRHPPAARSAFVFMTRRPHLPAGSEAETVNRGTLTGERSDPLTASFYILSRLHLETQALYALKSI
jgi:hypothetical protein